MVRKAGAQITSNSSTSGTTPSSGPHSRSRAAEQRHDQHLERDHRVEGDRRVDIGPARRHDRAGHAS